MKIKELIFKGLAFSGVLTLLASCATLNTAQQSFPDDVYGRTTEAPAVDQSDNSDYNQQYDDQYYAEDGYGDYDDGYDDGLSYANRISRFYYGTPGLPYYDPWVSHWDYYSPFYSPYGSSFSFGLGFGSSWYNPYYGYSSWGIGYPYGSYWGPYSYYGGGYYGGGYYGGYPSVVIRDRRTRPSRLGTDNVVTNTRPSRGTSSATRATSVNRTRPTVGDRLQRTRSIATGVDRPSGIRRPTTDQGRRPTSTRPAQQARPNQRPTQTRPAQQQRPTQTGPERTTRPASSVSRPSYTPSSSSPARSSSSGSGGGAGRSSRSR